MKRRYRVTLLVLGIPLSAVVLVLATLAWILATESGSRWAVEQARPYLPDGVGFGSFEGVLAGPFTLNGITLDSAQGHARIGRLQVNWSPLDLFWSELRISELVGTDVAIRIPEVAATGAQTEPAGRRLPDDLLLPVRVIVERLRIENITVTVGETIERVDRVALRAHLGPGEFAVTDIDIAAPLGSVSGHVRLDAGRPFGLDGRLGWRLRPPAREMAEFAGSLRLGGSLHRLQARLGVREPQAATLRLEARPFDEPLAWTGSLQLPLAMMRDWWSGAPALAVGAELDLAGGLEEIRVQGRADLEGLALGPVSARMKLRASAEAVMFEWLRLRAAQRPDAWVEASGRVEPGSTAPRFDVRAAWNDLAWPLTGEALAGSESGSLELEGTPDDYVIRVRGDLRIPQTGSEPVAIDAAARGSTESLEDVQASAHWHEATLGLEGRVRWTPDGLARLTLDLEDLDPQRIAEPLSGQLSARAGLSVAWGDTIQGRLELESLEGTLHGRSLRGSARVVHRGGVTEIEDLRLQAGQAELVASGRAGPELGLDWRAAIPDVGELLAGWGGRLAGSGRLAGTLAQPIVELAAEAEAVHSPFADVQSLVVEGRAAPFGGAETAVTADAMGIATEAITFESVRASLAGSPAGHRLQASLESDRGNARLEVTGAIDGARWHGSIDDATLASERLGEWQLAEPVALTAEAGALDTGSACLRNGDARVCASVVAGLEGWRTRIEAAQVPLALPASLAPGDLRYDGTFDLTARLSGEGRMPAEGEARIELHSGAVIGAIDEQPETLLAFRGGELEAALTRQSLAVRSELLLQGEDAIRMDARLGRAAPHDLAGRVQAQVGNLAIVTVLTPEIGRMEGILLADLELGGSLLNPAVTGSAALDSGLMQLVPLNIELTRIDADLAMDQHALEITLRAHSAGPVLARARFTRSEGEWSGEGAVSGTDVRVVNLPEAVVNVTPDLEWTLTGREVDVRGRVEVPSARLTARDLSSTVTMSTDTVIVGAATDAGDPPPPPWRVSGDVQVALGDAVEIDAFGLEGRLEGEIGVIEQAQKVTEATGELRIVDGTYGVYGQTLEIERGRLIFDGGPAANPGLDVRAVRRPRDVMVGVHVRGRLRDPRVTLFSEPPMQESQQLSYLLFGIPLRQTSEGQQSNLSVAAAALARSEQGARLAGRVGIQEISVDPGPAGEGASLVLGRYLSPRLYVGYGIGLMEQANSVQIRYDLIRNWTIEARSGVASSADLLYSIEVDSSADALGGLIETGTDEEGDAAGAGDQ